LRLSAFSQKLLAASFELNLVVIPNRHSLPVKNLLFVSIGGELGDDGIFPLLYPDLSYMTCAMAGFEPATFGL